MNIPVTIEYDTEEEAQAAIEILRRGRLVLNNTNGTRDTKPVPLDTIDGKPIMRIVASKRVLVAFNVPLTFMVGYRV